MKFIEDHFTKQKMMRTVLKALIVILVASVYFNGLRVLYLTAVNVIFAVLTEYLFETKILKRKANSIYFDKSRHEG